MDGRELEPRAKRGRGNSGDALASSMRGFRSGAGGYSQGLTHFRTSTGSRATGQSAVAKFDYINREGKYEKGREKADYMESGNLPEWAKENPRAYWEAADKYERSNGRLFVNSEFALPYGLDERQQIALASETAQKMARTKDGQPLPYSFAIHDAKGHNPHMHLIISERGLDGDSRSAETWFKKAPTGARKTTDLQHPDWVRETRREWCERANKYLEAAGAESRLDHRSFKEQGLDRLPTVHVGYTDPKRPQVRQQRQERNEAIKLANSAPEARKDLAKAEQQLAKVNAALRQIEARAEAAKAAALSQAQEQQPEPPRQVQDLAQQKDQVQKHQVNDQAQQIPAEFHAPKRPVQAQEPRRQDEAGGLGAAPPEQGAERPGAAVQQGAALPTHQPDLKAQEQQPTQQPEPKQPERPEWRVQFDKTPYPKLAEQFEALKAKANKPEPTFATVLEKHPDMIKARAEERAAKERSDKAALALKDRDKAHGSSVAQLAQDEKKQLAETKAAGVFDFARKKDLKAQAERLEQRQREAVKEAKALENLREEASRLNNARIMAEHGPVNVHQRELAPDSATHQQLAREIAEHRQETAHARKRVEFFGPLMAERAKQEAAKGQDKAQDGQQRHGNLPERRELDENQGRKLERLSPSAQRTLEREQAKRKAREGRGRGR